jgi:predicted kinase
MKKRIILISGFGGTGKTTTASILFNKLADCALVEADHLFIIKPWAIGEKLGRIKLRNSLEVMQTFASEEFHNIICVGLVWSQAELEAVESKFPDYQFDLFLFWLTANKETRFDRVVGRGEPGDTREFLEQVEQTIPNPWPLKSPRTNLEVIDTDEVTPEQVGQLMFERLPAN